MKVGMVKVEVDWHPIQKEFFFLPSCYENQREALAR